MLEMISREKEVWSSLDHEKYRRLGVDLTLLWENLKRSPTERIDHHQEALAFVEEIRRATSRGKVQKSH